MYLLVKEDENVVKYLKNSEEKLTISLKDTYVYGNAVKDTYVSIS